MIKFTKTELRNQQHRLSQLQKYLPTLQLKKMLLQMEINAAEQEMERLEKVFEYAEKRTTSFCSLFSDKNAFDLFPCVKVLDIETSSENIAGVEIPIFEKVIFQKGDYFLFDSPVWLESGILVLKELIEVKEHIKIVRKKKEALEKELREVSIRVNLFEKILIPRAQKNIKQIKVFLGDQQLAAVCQAKVSKQKILKRASV